MDGWQNRCGNHERKRKCSKPRASEETVNDEIRQVRLALAGSHVLSPSEPVYYASLYSEQIVYFMINKRALPNCTWTIPVLNF